MKKNLLTSALVMLCLFANAQSIQVKDLAGSVGSWQGNLTYLDYSSGKPFTMLANIKISLTADSRGYIMAYEYPKEPHANSKDTTAIVGPFFGKDKIVEFKRDSAEGFTFVTEVEGEDGNENRKAILRHQYLLQKNTFTITKSVKFQGTDNWIKRNEYLLTRAEIKPEISFLNDYKDVYHLSLIIYTPDGKIQTRVSNLAPDQIKTYSLPVATEIFIADWKQEAFAMKGNDIKATGVKPYLIVKESDANRVIKLSSIVQMPAKMYRIAKIKVDGNQLEKYKSALQEQMDAAIKLEPGVLSYTAVSDKKDPSVITIFEVYASPEAYQAHTSAPHFKKYKETVKDMVLSLELIDTELVVRSEKVDY